MVFWPPPPSAILYLCCAEPCLHVSPGFEHLLLVWWGNGPCFLGDLAACLPARQQSLGQLAQHWALRVQSAPCMLLSAALWSTLETQVQFCGVIMLGGGCPQLAFHCLPIACCGHLPPSYCQSRCIEVARLPCAALAPRWQEHYSLCGGGPSGPGTSLAADCPQAHMARGMANTSGVAAPEGRFCLQPGVAGTCQQTCIRA